MKRDFDLIVYGATLVASRAARAKELAGAQIDKMSDASATGEERTERKRRQEDRPNFAKGASTSRGRCGSDDNVSESRGATSDRLRAGDRRPADSGVQGRDVSPSQRTRQRGLAARGLEANDVRAQAALGWEVAD